MASGSKRKPDRPPLSTGRAIVLGIPLGLLAALLLWFGDLHLTHRDWLVGAASFIPGLGAAGVTVGILRRAGLVR